MNVALDKPMSLAQFLEWEKRQPLRYEFDGFRPVAMAGGTRAHSHIQRNLAIAVGGRLVNGPCEFHGSDFKVQTASDKARYPDGFVTCNTGADNDTIIDDPVVIFEVLSDGTANRDIGEKNAEYAAMQSVQRYVMLSQDRVGGTMFERVNGDWIGHLLTANSIIKMTEIGIEVPIEELYRRVQFAPEGDEAEADDTDG